VLRALRVDGPHPRVWMARWCAGVDARMDVNGARAVVRFDPTVARKGPSALCAHVETRHWLCTHGGSVAHRGVRFGGGGVAMDPSRGGDGGASGASWGIWNSSNLGEVLGNAKGASARPACLPGSPPSPS
jgi:hypothetical protein